MTVAFALAFSVGMIVVTGRDNRDTPVEGIRVPPGFAVTQFAGPELANDIYALHVSGEGRVLVTGRGYVRELLDTDKDGKADRAVDLVTGLRDGPMGVLLERDVLYLVADGGLKRYRLRDGTQADGRSAELVLGVKTGGEHDAHAVRRGLDGWLYLLCGNTAGVTAKTVTTQTSPVTNPVAGCLIRIDPGGKRVEVVADGFRNPYDFDFNSAGDAFTYDSDNERCVGLPWYEPTRFYFIVPGGHFGWLNPQVAQTWRRPPYFWDVIPPVATAGRGSPTGVCCYRRGTFPERFQDGFFLADWTFGRILFVKPRRDGGGYSGEVEPFVVAVGDAGFAPSGLAVHPATGDLLVSTGGRGTRGAVYRIRSTTPRAAALPAPGASPIDALRELLSAERELGTISSEKLTELIRTHAGHDDRWVRQAAGRLASRIPAPTLQGLLRVTKSDAGRIALATAAVRSSPEDARRVALEVLTATTARIADRIDATRLLQLALGDLTDVKAVGSAFEGYSPRRAIDPDVARATASRVRSVYPGGHPDLDRELSRTLAVLADDDATTTAKVIATLTAGSDPVEDVHTLIVLSRLRSRHTPDQTRAVADALLRVVEKADARSVPRDRHWPLRLAEAAAALGRKDAGLAGALLESSRFGRAGHVVFAQLPGLDRSAAARRFLKRSAADPDFCWLPEHVGLLAELPGAEVRDTLVMLWDRGGLQDSLIPIFARSPDVGDRDRYVSALRSHHSKTVATAAKALRALPDDKRVSELASLIIALRSTPSDEKGAREQLTATLRQRTGADLGADPRAWYDWAARNRADVSKELSTTGAGVDGTRKRLAGIDWSSGDAASGRVVFGKASCVVCHNGALAVGPSLEGVANRFGRDDLITAVIDPNRDVSPRYRVTRVSTNDGQVYQGVVIYEAGDGLILQTGATETVRVAGNRVESKRPGETSLMPAGLLDRLSDREVADLFAYMKSLGATALKSERMPGK